MQTVLYSHTLAQGSNSIAIAYDDGTVMIKVGREEPVASMDSSGKIIWARHNEIQTVNIKHTCMLMNALTHALTACTGTASARLIGVQMEPRSKLFRVPSLDFGHQARCIETCSRGVEHWACCTASLAWVYSIRHAALQP
eukprot:582866-Pelagomonas_calceolata.AAC.3